MLRPWRVRGKRRRGGGAKGPGGRARAAFVCSRINSRSYSASEAKMLNMSLLFGVVVSIRTPWPGSELRHRTERARLQCTRTRRRLRRAEGEIMMRDQPFHAFESAEEAGLLAKAIVDTVREPLLARPGSADHPSWPAAPST